MKFLVDAQLPKRLAVWLASRELDAIHAIDLPEGNRSTDGQILEVADRDQRIVVTKDADFVNSHLLRGHPAKLLLISTGNIRNQELELLVSSFLADILRELETRSFLELSRSGLTVRD